MKPAKTVSPFVLVAVVFVAVVLALTFALGRQPPGPTVESTVSAAATVEQVAQQPAPAKTEAQTQADAKAQADAKERRRRVTNQIINTAIGVSVLQ